MNKNKRKSRRILLSLLLIALTGVVLSTSTYAWFTANKTITVSDINVTVAAANGIQASVDARTWKTVISNIDITGASATYATATNQLPTGANTLSPVSTVGEIDTTTGFMKMFSGTIESNTGGNSIVTTLQSTETNGVTGNFVAFDLFLQVTTDNTEVFLTSNSKVIADGDSSGIENAARIAFIVEGNAATGTDPATIQVLHGGTSAIIWEPNFDTHTAAATVNASSNYAVTGLTAGSGNTIVTYRGVKAVITAANDQLLNSADTTYFTTVTPGITTPTSGILTTAYRSLLTLSAGITKVRIYMWIEGQDVDCENNASGGSITYSLQISTLSAAA